MIDGRARRRSILAIMVAAAVVVLIGIELAGPRPGRGPTATLESGGSESIAATSGPTSGTATPQALGPATSAPSAAAALPTCPTEIQQFPTGYGAYHTYAELCRAIVAAATAHSTIARLFSIGRSYQGREIWAMEITAHLTDGTHPPGVLFDGLHHGLEHLSLEMPLAIMGWLLNGYGTSTSITHLIRSRDIFIVFEVNPDGAAYDIAGGHFHEWRKNRQPGPGGVIGTDLNRNYDDHWGCCGLVSSDPSSAYYKGPAPFSAPETQAIRDFVLSRVFGSRQQIQVAITFHSSGRLVMWPYGYTRAAIPSDMTARDHSTFVALGKHMAALNGYTPEQASALYLDSGTARDWYYGKQGIFAFTFELGTGTYQRSSAIAPELARNKSAVLYLISMADCPYRAAGLSC
jgi:carboxypeptidase T